MLELWVVKATIFQLICLIQLSKKNTKTIADTQQETMKTAQELKQGDWFYINKNGIALAFIFDKMSKCSKIIGINPITKAQTRIDSSFEITKIEM